VDPDALLFTDKDGQRVALEDVINDGLDRNYSDRIPALVELAQRGAPDHRLYATAMLVAWGVPDGYANLAAWARDPASVPWASKPFTFDRFSGADSAFETLANAVATAVELDDERDDVAPLRRDALRALLGAYHRVFFGRSLMTALEYDKPALPALRDDLAAAIDRATAAARTPPPFDLATQAAFLLGPLARVDDERAARAADALLADHPGNERMVREIAHGLRSGTGPATLAIVKRLAESPLASVRTDARDSLAKRGG
jgi:hypothetical protein